MTQTKESATEKYYAMAVSWGEEYLKENKKPQMMVYKAGETINDDRLFVSTSIERIKHGGGMEKIASYNRLRLFKNFIEKTKTNAC